MGVSLDKHNKKKNTLRRRVINVLNPSGKAHRKAIWKRARRCAYGFASGFLTKRRREQAILAQRVLQWRYRKARESWAMDLYDVRSAFPSIGHQVLDNMIEEKFADPSDTELLKAGHSRPFVLLTAHGKNKVLL